MYNAYSHENSQKIEISNCFCENRSKNCFEFQMFWKFFYFSEFWDYGEQLKTKKNFSIFLKFRGGVTP